MDISKTYYLQPPVVRQAYEADKRLRNRAAAMNKCEDLMLRRNLEELFERLYLKVPWDIVATDIVPTIARSFHPRTITIANYGDWNSLCVQIGEYEICGGEAAATHEGSIMQMVKKLVTSRIFWPLYSSASSTGRHSDINAKYKEVPENLTHLLCKELVKSSVVIIPPNFPSAGHPSRNPIPACLGGIPNLIEHIHINLSLPTGQSRHTYYYPSDLYIMQNEIANIKQHFPHLKMISVTLTELRSHDWHKTFLARGRPSANMIMRITVPGSFRCEEETTLAEEAKALEVLLTSVVQRASVEIVDKKNPR